MGLARVLLKNIVKRGQEKRPLVLIKLTLHFNASPAGKAYRRGEPLPNKSAINCPLVPLTLTGRGPGRTTRVVTSSTERRLPVVVVPDLRAIFAER